MTDSDWITLGQQLRAPFPPEQVEFKPGRGNSPPLIYIDARAVQDRLDAVVGPGAWSFDWTPLVLGEGVQVVKATLTIHGVPKSDVGDGEKIEVSKAAVSDGLKRAAVMWGIGRYLYGLDVSSDQAYRTWYARQTAPQTTTTNGHAADWQATEGQSEQTEDAERVALRRRMGAAQRKLGWSGPVLTEWLKGILQLDDPATATNAQLRAAVGELERKANPQQFVVANREAA